jgi:hypothetical protein
MMSGFFPLGSLQVTTLIVRTSLSENDNEGIDAGVSGHDDMDGRMLMFDEYVLSSHATPLGSRVINLYTGPYRLELSQI